MAAARPSAAVVLDVADPGLHDKVRQLCVQLLPGWVGLSQESIWVGAIGGGITNVLLKARPPWLCARC